MDILPTIFFVIGFAIVMTFGFSLPMIWVFWWYDERKDGNKKRSYIDFLKWCLLKNGVEGE